MTLHASHWSCESSQVYSVLSKFWKMASDKELFSDEEINTTDLLSELEVLKKEPCRRTDRPTRILPTSQRKRRYGCLDETDTSLDETDASLGETDASLDETDASVSLSDICISSLCMHSTSGAKY